MSFAPAAVCVALGFVVPQILLFTENLLAEAVGLAIASGLAILAIEGLFLTQQARPRRILARTAKAIVAEASEIGMMVTRENGTWIASVIDSAVELEGEDIGSDWGAGFKLYSDRFTASMKLYAPQILCEGKSCHLRTTALG